MRFFEEQNRSRRETLKLVSLFVLAVVFVILLLDISILILLHGDTLSVTESLKNKRVLFFTCFITFLIVGVGYLYYRYKLSEGGRSVAMMLGGDEITNRSDDIYERRLINIVNEMAVAATIPVPSIFVLNNETSINAFAAGYTSNDYAIAVTRGALTKLTRDELQGVVAHETGHLINGDASLNLHLLSFLGGLMGISLVGKFMAELGRDSTNTRFTRGSDNNIGGLLILLGLVIWSFGMLGVFLGKMIKAMISREREYFADARAVQFTRNPNGLGSALRKIAGYDSNIKHYNSHLLSYMFLEGDHTSWVDSLFATHPSIKDRIERIYGYPMKTLKVCEYSEDYVCNEHITELVSGFRGISIRKDNTLIPKEDKGLQVRNIFGNNDMFLGLLIAIIDSDNIANIEHLTFQNSNKVLNFSRLFRSDLIGLSLQDKLIILNIFAPLIRSLPTQLREQIKISINNIIEADSCCTLEEFLFSSILYYRSSKAEPVHNKKLDQDVIPLVSAFCQLSSFSSERNFKDCMDMLGFSSKYTVTKDYAHLLHIVSTLSGLTNGDKQILINVLRVAGTNQMGMSAEAAGAINVISAVLEIPGSCFDSESNNFELINKILGN